MVMMMVMIITTQHRITDVLAQQPLGHLHTQRENTDWSTSYNNKQKKRRIEEKPEDSHIKKQTAQIILGKVIPLQARCGPQGG